MSLFWFYASYSKFLLCYFFSFFTEHRGLISYTNHFRQQYAAWKTECQNIVPIIGSGKFITAAIVTDDGQSLQDSNRDSLDQGWHVDGAISDKKVLQWMLGLHQIGTYVVHNFIFYLICIPFLFLAFKVAYNFWLLAFYQSGRSIFFINKSGVKQLKVNDTRAHPVYSY